MKTKIPQLRKMIRRLITESFDTMSPSDPDYETVAEVISQVTRELMFGRITTGDELLAKCEEIATDYGVSQHIDYIFDKASANKLRMGL